MIFLVLLQLVSNDFYFDNAHIFYEEKRSFSEIKSEKLYSAIYPIQALEHPAQSALFDSCGYLGFNENSREHLYSYQSHLGRLRLGTNWINEWLWKEKSAININSSVYMAGQIDQFYFYMEKYENFSFGDKERVNSLSRFAKSNYQKRHLEKTSSFDLSTGYMLYVFNKSHIFLGRIPWEIGYGESGKLIMNGFKQHYPISSFGIHLDMGIFRYHAMHGQLLATELLEIRPDSLNYDLVSDRQMPDKYIVSHRFELDLGRHLTLGMNEIIIYGNRSIDLNYLNPFHFVKPIEHELQDRDNAMISLSLKYRIPEWNLITYHELLLDEWRISELSAYFSAKEHWFGNKHAMLNGIRFFLANWQLTLESVQIAPYVYTHKYAVNRYSHDANPIGYEAGPNSLSYFVKLAHLRKNEYLISVAYKHVEKGQNFNKALQNNWNIGGDLFAGDNTRFKDSRSFLEGDRRQYDSFEIEFKHAFSSNISLSSRQLITNGDWQINTGFLVFF